jgi:thiol-disulfide isomerase/thioredoxin
MIYSFLLSLFISFAPVLKKQAEVITLEQLRAKTIQPNNDTLYVVNFWATWCKPCVGELPGFEAAGKKFADKAVKIELVSLDFISDKESVNQFIQEKNIQSNVYLLQAGDPNIWIDKIDTTWSGAIPATVLYKNGKKVYFHEGDFTQQVLDSLIQTKI